ncbi:hypothetical protein GH714_009046 [Hevea brasiliensis]|uniref:Chromo domain-containing protein n=1 Tax=Hevea brasiliensis TaxID=3981 RepID=A0A6A6LKD7_HEVBR|nr:hypothetical protein GH714_009046 [Hevea brasiliensis]
MSASNQSHGFNRPRLVTKKVLATPSMRAMVLLLEEALEVTPPAGFPDHPHRGFETVTYMLQGGITHQDFAGHKGTIHAGDVQWMTAGRGIIHSEMPAGEGTQKGLQLWINLSSEDKISDNDLKCLRLNQGIKLLSDDIQRAEKDGAEVRVIAGESMGVRSPVYTRTPTMFLDFTLKPRAQVHQTVPESWNAFVYVIEGEGAFGLRNSSQATAHHVLVLGTGDGLSVWIGHLGLYDHDVLNHGMDNNYVFKFNGKKIILTLAKSSQKNSSSSKPKPKSSFKAQRKITILNHVTFKKGVGIGGGLSQEDMNISPIFNVEDLSPYRGTFEPPTLPSSVSADQLMPKSPSLPQLRDIIDTILDDEFVTSSRGGFHRFLVKWQGCPDFDATWITQEEFQTLDPFFLNAYLQINSMESSSF